MLTNKQTPENHVNVFLVTQTEAADISGISKTTINTKSKGELVEGRHGTYINIDHPCVIGYFAKKGVRVTEEIKQQLMVNNPTILRNPVDLNNPPESRGAPRKKLTEVPDLIAGAPLPPTIANVSIEHLENLTLSEIATQYGGIKEFINYITALKMQMDFINKKVAYEEKRGVLIKRDVVMQEIMMNIHVLFERLLTIVPQSVTPLIAAVIKMGGDDVDASIEKIIKGRIEGILTNTKEQMKNHLN